MVSTGNKYSMRSSCSYKRGRWLHPPESESDSEGTDGIVRGEGYLAERKVSVKKKVPKVKAVATISKKAVAEVTEISFRRISRSSEAKIPITQQLAIPSTKATNTPIRSRSCSTIADLAAESRIRI
jgi:hypothetical protein